MACSSFYFIFSLSSVTQKHDKCQQVMGFIYCKHHTNTKDKHKQTHNKQLLARVEHKKGQKPNRSMTDVCLPEQNISPRVQLCITLNKCSHCRINQHVHNRKGKSTCSNTKACYMQQLHMEN